jgi:hypothetical protein
MTWRETKAAQEGGKSYSRYWVFLKEHDVPTRGKLGVPPHVPTEAKRAKALTGGSAGGKRCRRTPTSSRRTMPPAARATTTLIAEGLRNEGRRIGSSIAWRASFSLSRSLSGPSYATRPDLSG